MDPRGALATDEGIDVLFTAAALGGLWTPASPPCWRLPTTVDADYLCSMLTLLLSSPRFELTLKARAARRGVWGWGAFAAYRAPS